jgi:biotin carboxyl carrier protein
MATKKKEQENNHQEENNQADEKKNKTRFSSLVVDGTKYRTILNDKFKDRKKWDDSHKGEVYSEFPGTVIKVDVNEGDEIEKGDRLYIYDAMKMKNRAYSPVEGKVKKVRIKENDIIRKGQLLFVIK